MTDLQLVLAIGVPLVWQCLVTIGFLVHDRAYWRRLATARLHQREERRP